MACDIQGHQERPEYEPEVFSLDIESLPPTADRYQEGPEAHAQRSPVHFEGKILKTDYYEKSRDYGMKNTQAISGVMFANFAYFFLNKINELERGRKGVSDPVAPLVEDEPVGT